MFGKGIRNKSGNVRGINAASSSYFFAAAAAIAPNY
jgi:hypothetical protein